MKFLIIYLIKKYIAASPKRYSGRCVLNPSCSLYSLMCFKKYGTLAGVYLTLKRFNHCVPKNSGDDFVPVKLSFYYPFWLKYL